MRGEHFYGHTMNSRKRGGKSMRPTDQRGVPETGRVIKLLVGQGHGFIRLDSGQEVFFHRSDVQPGASINDFSVGDPVSFELLNDVVSGARALRVRRRGH